MLWLQIFCLTRPTERAEESTTEGSFGWMREAGCKMVALPLVMAFHSNEGKIPLSSLRAQPWVGFSQFQPLSHMTLL